MIRQIEILGDAVKRLSLDLTSPAPDVPWRQIAGTQGRLIQGHFQVDLQAVWAKVTGDLPPLQQRVQGLLDRASRLRAAFQARTACEPGVETFDTLTPRRAAPRKLLSLFRKVPFARALA